MYAQKPRIWVDADACPIPIKELLVCAAKRKKIETVFVANQPLNVGNTPFVSFTQVQSGFDVADHYIVSKVSTGDLVVTQDIPLADEVITLGALAIGPRGDFYTKENIKSRLNMRDFMETMRSSGIQSGGPAPFSKSDVQTFANRLDSWLNKQNS